MTLRDILYKSLYKIKAMLEKIPIPKRLYKVRAPLAALCLAILIIGSLSASSLLSPLARIGLVNAQCNSIADCNAQINAGESAVAQLREQATSYEDAIDRLRSQINNLQSAIDANQAQQASLQQQIVAAQAKITHQKKILGENITAMYVDGRLSTIEELATSKNLSDFVDKEEYRIIAQGKIDTTIKQIAQLQRDLQAKKAQIEALLLQQQHQQNELVAARQEQQRLFAYNESQQATYNAQTSSNKQKLAQLIAAQRRVNNNISNAKLYFLRFPGNVASHNPAAYPYKNAGFSMSTAPGCPEGQDDWGYCTRQCVSYAAWAVAASGRSAPRYYGNAKDWVAAAQRNGVPVYTSDPQRGDVVIDTAGTWGHAMYVEEVSGGRILVSQYNQQLTGEYSTQWRSY